MGKKGSKAVAPDPAIGQAMQKQAEIMERQQQWYENTIYPWLKQQTNLQNEYSQDDRLFQQDNAQWWKDYYQAQSDKQNARSDELYERYQKYYKPVEDQLIEEANKYNTSAEAQKQAQTALNTTAGQYSQQRQALAMRMGAYGINANDGLYAEQARASSINEAAAKAQAANKARQSAIDLGWQKQLQLSQLGSGYLGNSLNFSNTSNTVGSTGASATSSAIGQASALGQLGTQNITQMSNIGLNSYQNMSNAWGQYGQMGQTKTNYNQQVQNAKDQASAAKASGIATGVGTVGAMAIAI